VRSLVITPTYNERDNIARLIPAVLRADPAVDILVVDDASPDGTGRIAETFAVRSGRVNVLHRSGKQGLGAAYLAGFRYALDRDYAQIVEMDADLSHNPADLPRLLAPVRAGEADLTLGSRWAAGGGTKNWPLRRQLISRLGSLYARTILGVPVRDLTGGFKCFNRRALAALDLEAVRTSGYGFQVELTYAAIQAGFRVREVPILFTEREHGVSKMSNGIIAEAMLMVWRLRFANDEPRAAGQATLQLEERAVGDSAAPSPLLFGKSAEREVNV
jgi:dolichol-phosphate mannosyltransferase